MKTITLHTKNTTYQLGISPLGFVHHLYYGPKASGDMSALLSMRDRGFSGNPYESRNDRTYSMDALPVEYPCYGCGDYRSPAFNISDEKGIFGADLRYKSHQLEPGKYTIPGLPAVYPDTSEPDDIQTLKLVLEDARLGAEVTLYYGIFPELDVITRTVSVKNNGKGVLHLHKVFSAALDFISGGYDLLHFHGRHAMERLMERSPLSHGTLTIGSFRGTSSHQHNPFVILARPETTEDFGDCYGLALLYSGNFKCEAMMDQYGQTRLMMGLSDDMLDYALCPGETFYAPEAAMAYSSAGLAQLSHIFHKLIRTHVCRGRYRDIRRPVLINNWEATYFNFTGEKIINIARQAASLGVELMVLDDGWFGRRSDDNSSLGDWYVNEEKLGCSMAELAESLHGIGMKFGLWIEPEMVSEDSNLYRAHPDWAFIIPGKPPVMSRNQLVLDFSRKEVVDYIFAQMTEILDHASIDYIKMDMNRSICDVYTAVSGRQNYGTIMYRYVLGVYDFLERLTARYPNILFEGCSGGGGRFDAGMLYYTPQIWCSDNTDAIDRIRIQHGTSFCYPSCCVGAHVSAVPNHQTGRVTPLKTRAVTAMAGTFGYELDLGTLDAAEKQQVQKDIAAYKSFWPLMHDGMYYRLTDPNTPCCAAAWAFVSPDRTEALVSVVVLEMHGNAPAVYIRLKGLAPEKQYVITATESAAAEGLAAENAVSGSVLMHTGIPLPAGLTQYDSIQYYLAEVSDQRRFRKV